MTRSLECAFLRLSPSAAANPRGVVVLARCAMAMRGEPATIVKTWPAYGILFWLATQTQELTAAQIGSLCRTDAGRVRRGVSRINDELVKGGKIAASLREAWERVELARLSHTPYPRGGARSVNAGGAAA